MSYRVGWLVVLIAALAGASAFMGCSGGSDDPGGGGDDPDPTDSDALAATGRICGFLYSDENAGTVVVEPLPRSAANLEPLVDAQLRTDTGAFATTNSLGAFAFDSVPVGLREVEVDAEGYFDDEPLLSYRVTVREALTSAGKLEPDGESAGPGAAMGYAYRTEDGALLLSASRRTDAAPLADATLTFGGAEATTNTAGFYLAEGLTPGTLKVTAAAGASGDCPVTISAGLTTAGADDYPNPRGAARGYVGLCFRAAEPYLTVAAVRSDVQSIRGAVVSLDSGQKAITNSVGRYVLYGLEPGVHTLTVSVTGTGGFASVVIVAENTVTAGLLAPRGSIGKVKLSLPSDVTTPAVGRTFTLDAVATTPGGTVLSGFSAYTWTTSDASIASVDQFGEVTGLKIGSVTISAAAGGVAGAIALDIAPFGAGEPYTVAVATVGPPIVDIGDTRQILAKVYDKYGTLLPEWPVAYGSSDETVATVSSSGVVGAVGGGVCHVTVSATGTVSAALEMQVIETYERLAANPDHLGFVNGGEGVVSIWDRIGGYGGVMDWTAAASEPWISVAPESGQGDAALSVTVDGSGLPAGQYTGQVIVDAGAYGKRGVVITLDVQEIVIIIE